MTTTVQNQMPAKDSNRQTTQAERNTESVKILFGLKSQEIRGILEVYYDNAILRGVAIMEMFENVQRAAKEREDASVIVAFSRGVSILTEIEKAEWSYRQYIETWDGVDDEEIEEVAQQEEESRTSLHQCFIRITKKIEEFGFCKFIEYVTGSISFIETKEAYE